ncbi:MAG: amidohydrolase [Myxococcales bacterium]|nr:amidohydrolase [Myxococcales bacterium]
MSGALSRRKFVHSSLLASTAAALGCEASPVPRDQPAPAPAKAPPPPEPEGADLLIVGGAILTLDPEAPRAEALAASGGQLIAVGSRAQVEALRGPNTRVLDLAGGLAVPGLTDAHAHLSGLGKQLEDIDLAGVSSEAELLARVRAQADKQPEGWLVGRGWDQNRWPALAGAMPTHHALSEAFPDRPVWLRRVDGHAGLANQTVLKLAGITEGTPDPRGGEILRDERGAATGVLVDAAMGLVPVPAARPEALRRWLLGGQARALALGITGVHDMGVGAAGDALYRALAQAGELRLRVHAYADHDWFARDLVGGPAPAVEPAARYALKGVKLYIDGALGSRGAALLEDYSDRRGHRGMLQHPREELVRLCAQAHGRGWQIASHAIGDRGIREALDIYEAALGEGDAARRARWRVEHSQIVAPEDIPRYAARDIIASMQPTHATSDMPWVPARVGPDRLAGAYAWRRFLDAGVALALGSDFPVEQPNITHGLYAAVTRQDAEGQPEGGWLPDQRLTLEQGIAGFSRGAAYAVHRERSLGVLARGYQADITCFQRDITTLPPVELRDAAIRATIVAGEVAWEA